MYNVCLQSGIRSKERRRRLVGLTEIYIPRHINDKMQKEKNKKKAKRTEREPEINWRDSRGRKRHSGKDNT